MDLKERLYAACLAYVRQQIDNLQASIDAAHETSRAETKSSAGDKYETTRAMMQLDIERYMKSLAEAQNLQKQLACLPLHAAGERVSLGSLVETNMGTFFLAIGIGQLKLEEKVYFVVSPQSPIGAQLMQKKSKETFVFNKKNCVIGDIS